MKRRTVREAQIERVAFRRGYIVACLDLLGQARDLLENERDLERATTLMLGAR